MIQTHSPGEKPIVVLGDLMLDVFYHGEVKKLNPESSAPMLSVDGFKRIEQKLGGAGNVANNLCSLGAKTVLIGGVGKDVYGSELKKLVKLSGIHLYPLKLAQHTTIKSRGIDHRVSYQQVFRCDIEERAKLAEKHYKEILDTIAQSDCEYVIISDYNKGIITGEVMNVVLKICHQKGIKIIADVKPNNVEHFKNCFLIKPNFVEFKAMTGIDIPNEDKYIEKHGKAFAKEMHTNLLITRGNKGASYITRAGKCHHLKTEAQQVFDVTGAGDTFIAVLTYGLANHMDIIDAIKLGNKAAGIIVGKPGTAVISRLELQL